ncbi:MAG: phosphoribosylglycinamide formyltransferase [Gammaproteobacteria bacterium]|nr:phosphoribosylglycinamide formyltransferase [Gammaproteobacteria bacterium]
MSSLNTTQRNLPLVVLVSGAGTNLQAILEACAQGSLPATVEAVISDRGTAPALQRAAAAGITTHVLQPQDYPDRASYDRVLALLIDSHAPGLVVLAGFMRILNDAFVQHYRGRMVNIHPALLPKYRGLRTHRRVLAAGEREPGSSVQFVTRELDGGPVIAQSKVPVRMDDTERSLTARVQACEHRLYPQVIRWIAEGRVRLADESVVFDGARRRSPVIMDWDETTS